MSQPANSLQTVCEVSLCGCNQTMSEVHSSLQKVLEKEGKTKIEKCNHPTPEAYNSWQTVLKKQVEMK